MTTRGASALCDWGIDEGWTIWCESAAIEDALAAIPVDPLRRHFAWIAFESIHFVARAADRARQFAACSRSW